MSYTSRLLTTIPLLTVLSFSAVTLPVAAVPLIQENAQQAFQQSYQKFQRAQASDSVPREQLKELAYDAFEKGEAHFGRRHMNTATLALNYLLMLNAQERIDAEHHKLAQLAATVYRQELAADDLALLDPLLLALETMPEANTEALASYEAALSELYAGWPETQVGSRIAIRVQVAKQLMRLGQSRPGMWQTIYEESLAHHGASHSTTLQAGYFSGLSSIEEDKGQALAILERVANTEVGRDGEALQIQVASYYTLAKLHMSSNRLNSLADTLSQIKVMQANLQNNVDKQLIKRVNPRYPTDEARDGKEGAVLLQFDINQEGNVENIRVLEETSKNFGRLAIEALSKWRYIPAFENGQPVAVENEKVQLDFSLGAPGPTRHIN
jgi:TonB family protein